MAGVIAGLPLYSTAVGRAVASVPLNEAKDAADDKCDGLEIEVGRLSCCEATFELPPLLACGYYLDDRSIDTHAAFVRDHLQRGPPRW